MKVFGITDIGKTGTTFTKQLWQTTGCSTACTSHRSDIEPPASEELNRTTTMPNITGVCCPGFP
jgi:hypothetical protein